jgi:hypothetical protein
MRISASAGSGLHCKWLSSGYQLQNVRHAVLTTLYSHAYRIGLNDDSCFLRSLCNSVSLDLFLLLIAGVLD